MHSDSEEKRLRYVYIIEVDNYYKKSKFYGLTNVLYVGETNNLLRRLKEHVSLVNSGFLAKNFPNSRKKLVFVNYVFGTEYDSMREEKRLKRLSRDKKLELINSAENKLVAYVPLKCVILKKFDDHNCEVVLRF